MPIFARSWAICALFLAAVTTGCGRKTDTKAEAKVAPAQETAAVPDQPMAGPAAVSDQPPAEPSASEPAAGEPPSAEPAANEPAPAAAADSTTQTSPATGLVANLPASDLVAGLPGEGPLQADEIERWLADGTNHEVLEVRLPLGLSAGQKLLRGVDRNPLTKAKIELGRQLYFDARLSADGTISCASCHDPAEGYARHTQFGVGINGQMGGRNSPVSYNRILSDAQFWDGRAATLEEQAKGPIANPIEMGNTHEKCVATLQEIPGYRAQFEKIFGGVTIDAVAQAIASFERVIVTGPSPFDYYERYRPFEKLSAEEIEDLEQSDPDAYKIYVESKAAMVANPMSESALRGRNLYFSDKAGCSACHVGPNLTDEKFHNIGVGMDKPEPDLGRYAETNDEKDRGAFKTPTIRNVALSAPYMHDGSQKTLEEVVEFYAKGGHPNPHLSEKIKKLELSDQDKKDLVEFMKACTGPFPKVQTGRLPE